MSSEVQNATVRTTERAIRLGIVAVFVVGVRRRDPGAVVNALLALAGSYLPDAVERRYAVAFRPWQRVYTEAVMLTHSVGMLGPYDDVWWWDHVTHAHAATVVGSVVHAAARRTGRDDPRTHVVASVIGAGAVWEAVEYATHGLSRRVGLDPLLVQYGRSDTTLDMVFNLIGALVVVVFADGLLENFVEHADGTPESEGDGDEAGTDSHEITSGE